MPKFCYIGGGGAVSGKARPLSRLISTFRERAELVNRLPWRLRLAALGEGLAACSPDEAEVLAPMLVELAVRPVSDGGLMPVPEFARKALEYIGLGDSTRRCDLALGALAQGWGRLPLMARRAAVAVGVGRWHAVIGGLHTDPRAEVRASIADLSFDAGDARLAGVAAELLGDVDSGVASKAERAVVGLALRARTFDGDAAGKREDVRAREAMVGLADPWGLEGEADAVYAAVTTGCRRFEEHRKRGVILAAVILLGRNAARFGGPRGAGDGRAALATWFNTADEETLNVIRSVLASTSMPLMRVRALEWLARPSLAGACARRLSRATTVEVHNAVLEASHLLLRPARRVGAKAVEHGARVSRESEGKTRVRFAAGGALPEGNAYAQLSLNARRGLPRFMEALGVDGPVRAAELAWGVAEADPQAKLAAVWALPSVGVTDFCFDASGAVASAAATRWARGSVTERTEDEAARARFAALLARSPVGYVRRLGEEEARIAAGVWGGGAASALAGQFLLRGGREIAAEALRRGLADADEARRVQSLWLIRRLRLVDDVLADLIAASADVSARVAASACAALGEARSPQAEFALGRALLAADARVRANAAEAVAKRRGRGAGVLIEHKDDAHHRVRANVVRAGLGELIAGYSRTDALGSLRSMLEDGRAEHRRAGAWAASRIVPWRWPAGEAPALTRLWAQVRDLAERDSDEGVRARAGAFASRRFDGLAGAASGVAEREP